MGNGMEIFISKLNAQLLEAGGWCDYTLEIRGKREKGMMEVSQPPGGVQVLILY
jgi:hypothetical protein|tara:strand:+ start:193 stop:354 length:162 start_codon:yes stop_codon:yes gene_type:complete